MAERAGSFQTIQGGMNDVDSPDTKPQVLKTPENKTKPKECKTLQALNKNPQLKGSDVLLAAKSEEHSL